MACNLDVTGENEEDAMEENNYILILKPKRQVDAKELMNWLLENIPDEDECITEEVIYRYKILDKNWINDDVDVGIQLRIFGDYDLNKIFDKMENIRNYFKMYSFQKLEEVMEFYRYHLDRAS